MFGNEIGMLAQSLALASWMTTAMQQPVEQRAGDLAPLGEVAIGYEDYASFS